MPVVERLVLRSLLRAGVVRTEGGMQAFVGVLDDAFGVPIKNSAHKKGRPLGEPLLMLRMVRHQESNYTKNGNYLSSLCSC
jgi:hypothetical protein